MYTLQNCSTSYHARLRLYTFQDRQLSESVSLILPVLVSQGFCLSKIASVATKCRLPVSLERCLFFNHPARLLLGFLESFISVRKSIRQSVSRLINIYA